MPNSDAVLKRASAHIGEGQRIEEIALEIAEDNYDFEIARARLAQPDKLVEGSALLERLVRCET